MRSVELFAGCGGLALGLAQAGFEHELVVEMDDEAHATLGANKKCVKPMSTWPLQHGDVRDVDYSGIAGNIDLVAGGPPCQPFSIGGKHLGPVDPRNMWPEAVRAVRELTPKAFLFENVRGLLRPGWSEYLDYLKLYLAWPHVVGKSDSWGEHHALLTRHAAAPGNRLARYKVIVQPINTADYGAPQKRHRAIVMGIRTDVATEWDFPAPTHSREALLWHQWIDDGYWKRHGISEGARPVVPQRDENIVERLRSRLVRPSEKPWVTVRDAFEGLPPPTEDKEPVGGHRLRPGARTYTKHTGSNWDAPAKALKAGDHGVPGGENMVVLRDGTVRYFTLREMARLQGFPDDFRLGSGWKRPIKQLGNAVPVPVGRVLGEKIACILKRVVASSDKAA